MNVHVGIHNIYLYCIIGANLLIGTLLGTNFTVVVQLVIFALWDISYYRKKDSFRGRPPKTAVEHVGLLTCWVSYFVPFYGVLFGILFVSDPEEQKGFLDLCNSAEMPISLLLVPFVFASLAAIFVPIQIALNHDKEVEELSPALKSLFCIKVFFSQTTIFVFVHCILRLVASLR